MGQQDSRGPGVRRRRLICELRLIALAGLAALVSSGCALSWGYNNYGQLGDGTNTDRSMPVLVSADGWDLVSGGMEHSCGVRTEGTAWCWGSNIYGRLGTGTNTSSSVPVQVGGAGGFSDWVSVSAGAQHSCGVRSTGTAWCWGYNGLGQLGDGTNTKSNVPVPVGGAGGFTDWVSVSAAIDHSCGVRSTGTAWCWGLNGFGALGDGTNTLSIVPVLVSGGFTDWVSVSAGTDHSCGVRTNGTAWCWGSNYGRLGDGTNTNSNVPVQVGGAGGFTDWISVSAGSSHSCGARAEGTAWCWGGNWAGQLGDGTNTNTNVPVQVGTATNWDSIVAGWYHTVGVAA